MDIEYVANWYIDTFPTSVLLEFKKHLDVCEPSSLARSAFGGINYVKSTGSLSVPSTLSKYNLMLPARPAGTYQQVMEIVFNKLKTRRLLKFVGTLE